MCNYLFDDFKSVFRGCAVLREDVLLFALAQSGKHFVIVFFYLEHVSFFFNFAQNTTSSFVKRPIFSH